MTGFGSAFGRLAELPASLLLPLSLLLTWSKGSSGKTPDSPGIADPVFRSLFESAPDAILIVDSVGHIILFNKKAEALFGYSQGELLGKPVEVLVPSHLHQEHAQHRARYSTNPQARPMGTGRDLRGLRKDGTEFPVDIALSKVESNGQALVTAVVRDMTGRVAMERELRQSEDRLRKIFDHSNDAILLLNPEEDRILQVNARACQMLGYSQEELLSLPVSAIHANDMPKLLAFTQKVRQWGHGWIGELICKTKAGHSLTTEISASTFPREDDSGPANLIAMVRDVTERLQAEEERQKLVALVENSSEFVAMASLEGRVQFLNPAGLKLAGLDTLEQARSKTLFDFHPEEEAERIRETVSQGLQTQGNWEGELSLKHFKSGQLIPARVVAFTIRDSQTQRPIALAAVMRDIAEQKHSEQALRQSEERFRAIAELSPSPIIITRISDGLVLYANDQTRSLFGVDLRDAEKYKATDFYCNPDDRQQLLKKLEREGFVRNEELQYKTTDGSQLCVLVSQQPLSYRGEAAVLSVFTDITERKKMEEALQQSEVKFSKVFRSAPIPMSLSRVSDGTLIDVNNAFCLTSGYSCKEAIGHTVYDLGLITAEERSKVVGKLEKDGRVRNIEVVMGGRDGRNRSLIYSAETVEVDGEPCLLASGLDVTERKQAEDALRQSEEKFSKLFQSAPIPMSLTRVSDGTLLDVNDRFVRVSGYPTGELVGQSLENLELMIDPVRRLRIVDVLQKDGLVRDRDLILRTKSGEDRSLLYSAERVEVDGETCVLASALDVTERKQAQEALAQSAGRFRGLIESLPMAARVIQDGRIKFANAADARLFGFEEPGQVIGTEAYAHIAEEDVERLRDYSRRRAEGDSTVPSRYEARLMQRDGTEFPAEVVASVIAWDGETASLAVTQDLTDRKRLHLFESILPVCSICGKVRDDSRPEDDSDRWSSLEHFVKERSDASLSHTFCPICFEEYRRDQGLPAEPDPVPKG